MRTFFLSVGATLGCVLLVSVAKAEETPDAVRADALFQEGRRLMVAEDYAAACPKLAESQALAPLPDTAFDLGLCYQKASQAAFRVAHDLARPSEQTPLAVPSATSESDQNTSGAGQTQRVVGLTIGGTGVAGIVTGIVTAFMARTASNQATSCLSSANFECSRSQNNSARDLATASTISLLTGAAAVGAGVVVFLVAPRSKPSTGAAVGLRMAPSTQGADLSVVGRF